MKDKERKDYVAYRIESAYQTLEAAKLLAENGFWNSAMNRLYYAAFYIINAVLVKNEIACKTHASVKSQFALHFIKPGLVDKKYGHLLSELFDWRQKGDYDNVFDYNEETVVPLIKPVEDMLKFIRQHLLQS